MQAYLKKITSAAAAIDINTDELLLKKVNDPKY